MTFLNNISIYKEKYDISVIVVDTIPIDRARNELVSRALKDNPDYVLFMDTDNIGDSHYLDVLVNTLEQTNADLVSGLYFSKQKPYYPVIRYYQNDRYWNISSVKLNTVTPIDGCGMGYCLIRANVFDKLKEPYFKSSYELRDGKPYQLSEDLYFCRQLLNNKFKMLCDTRVLLKHIGGIIDSSDYEAFLTIQMRLNEEKVKFVEDISEFTKESVDDINAKIKQGGRLIGSKWKEQNPQTSKEITNFYKTTPDYVYDLTNWHFGNRRQFDDKLINNLVQSQSKNILDYGGGIGINSHRLCRAGLKVTLADLDSVTLDFAKFRRDKYGLNYKIWCVDTEQKPKTKYDAIICLDVLEHLSEVELIKTIDTLISLKSEDCQIIITTNFGKTDLHPMHIDLSEKASKKIKELLGNE